MGHSAFGFVQSARGHQTTRLSFSLVSDAPSLQAIRDASWWVSRPRKIRCTCGACGHKNTTMVKKSKIFHGESGEQSVRVKCGSCGAGMTAILSQSDSSKEARRKNFDPNQTKEPMKIRCPCGACGHLNTAVIDDSKIIRDENGERQQPSARVKCENCGAGMTVRVAQRDPRLSI